MNLAGSRIVVTGGTGFLGQQVVRELDREGVKVVGVGSRDYDLRSRDRIERLIDDTTPGCAGSPGRRDRRHRGQP